MEKIKIDFDSWFYRNCKIQRRKKAKICQVCPFRNYIEQEEQKMFQVHRGKGRREIR